MKLLLRLVWTGALLLSAGCQLFESSSVEIALDSASSSHGLPSATLSLLRSGIGSPIDARMLRYPDVSADLITFVYAGDIWIAPKEGGAAHRLSSPRGEESFPRFSPDGLSIAFSANYDGASDIYVVATAGGLPLRLTHHPSEDRMLDWYPDGKSILFATGMTSSRNRFNQLYKTSVQGGLPEKLPLPYGEFGSIAPDGKTLAYIMISRDFRTWKRYRGGMAPDIWLFDLEELTSKKVTHGDSNDAHPMWRGQTLYFLSDRDENRRANIWAYDTQTEAFRQVTRFTEFDVRFPAIGPEEIVFENGGRLYLLDLDDEGQREVEISIVTDRATLKQRPEKVGDSIQNYAISPSGKRALFEARGEVFSVPAEHGVVLNLTRSSGVAERFPVWSPDGEHVAYFSDRSGEYELTLRRADGSEDERTLTSLGAGFRYQPYWSPDSKKIAFIDQTMTIQVFDLDSEKAMRVDSGDLMFHGTLSSFRPSWSADSRWLAYSRPVENANGAIFIFDTKSEEVHQATSGFYEDFSPAFDPRGKYLYFLTRRSFAPSYGDLDGTWIYANSTVLAAMSLRANVGSPLAPRNDLEPGSVKKKKKDEKAEEDEASPSDSEDKKDEKKTPKKKKKKTKDVEIDFDDLERRAVILPPKAGNLSHLEAVAGKLIYRRRSPTGTRERKQSIQFYRFKERDEKTIVEDIGDYRLSADGKKLLVRKGSSYSIVDIKAKQKLDKKLPTSDLETMVDPAAEWRQLFTDAWRFERDYFYDPNLHGVDWEAMRERYGRLMDDAVTRWDVNFVIGEMIAELNASHTYRSGGDLEQSPSGGAGLLGVRFTLENGAYRIADILDGAAWDIMERSPLAAPGVKVNEGDYLLAINGVALDTSKDPWAAFEGLAEKSVILTVNDEPKLEGARDILVETIADESRLSYLAWIENNRKKVDEATDGRVGYVYVPDTGRTGQTELVRQYLGQYAKEGLIIDERFNSGGQIPDRFIELLNRPLYNYWAVRDGRDIQSPRVSHMGPKVMLINGWSGSGGDAFPYYFKRAGLGPLIGTRTWGGLIGISGVPLLIDGGRVTVPTFGIYSTQGEWIIEGYGVEPDIEVVDDPALMTDGGDPQLERAIEEVMKSLTASPPERAPKPAYPLRSGR